MDDLLYIFKTEQGGDVEWACPGPLGWLAFTRNTKDTITEFRAEPLDTSRVLLWGLRRSGRGTPSLHDDRRSEDFLPHVSTGSYQGREDSP
jgi:hypothetical protein